MASLPAIGSRWREDYDYGGGWDRIVEVVGYAEDGRVMIRAASTDKRPNPSSRITKATADRFGKSRGYLPT